MKDLCRWCSNSWHARCGRRTRVPSSSGHLCGPGTPVPAVPGIPGFPIAIIVSAGGPRGFERRIYLAIPSARSGMSRRGEAAVRLCQWESVLVRTKTPARPPPLLSQARVRQTGVSAGTASSVASGSAPAVLLASCFGAHDKAQGLHPAICFFVVYL
jgi:hypothetical protein